MPLMNLQRRRKGIFDPYRNIDEEEIGLRNSGIFDPYNPNSQQNEIGLPQNGLFGSDFKIKQEPINNGVISPPISRGLMYPGLEEYKKHIGSQPRKEEHQLNKFGKLLAGVAGVAEGYNRGVGSGIETGIGLMERPYRSALEDWERRGTGLKEKADIEVKLEDLEYRRGQDKETARYREAENIRQNKQLELQQNEDARQKEELADRILSSGLNREEQRKRMELLGWDSSIVEGRVIYTNLDGTVKVGPKVGETIEEKEAREIRGEGRQEAANIRQEDRAQSNRKELLDYGLEIDKRKAQFVRENKPNELTPAEAARAFELAVEQTRMHEPDLVNELFVVDPNTRAILGIKPDVDKDKYQQYMDGINARAAIISRGGNTSTTGTTTTSQTPVITDPIQKAAREAAIAWLVQNGYDANDEDNIKNAIAQLKKVSSTAPPVSAPPIYPGLGTVGKR